MNFGWELTPTIEPEMLFTLLTEEWEEALARVPNLLGAHLLRMEDDGERIVRIDRMVTGTTEALSLTGSSVTRATFDLRTEWADSRREVRWEINMVEPVETARCCGQIVLCSAPRGGSRVVVQGELTVSLAAALGRSEWLDDAIAPNIERLVVRLIKRNATALFESVVARRSLQAGDAA